MALHLAEYILGDQLLQIDGRFDLGEPPASRHKLVRASRTDLDEPLADQTLGLDRDDRVRLELDAVVDPERDPRLVILEAYRLDAADRDAGDLDGGPGLEAAHRREVREDDVPSVPEYVDPAKVHGQVRQRNNSHEHEQPNPELHPSTHGAVRPPCAAPA